MKMKIKTPRTATLAASSAAAVASIDDLLIQILLRLPVRSLYRFKSVSTHWLALITSPEFTLLRGRSPNPAVGLFLIRPGRRCSPKLEYVDFSTTGALRNPPFRELEFTRDPSFISVLQSCNGLLLCSSFLASPQSKRRHYIYNPVVNQHHRLPELFPGEDLPPETKLIMSLAFDPSKSPHYKVLVRVASRVYDQTLIYSSETCLYTKIRDPTTSARIDKKPGIYWNGSINWCQGDTKFQYLNLETEALAPIPTPPPPPLTEETHVYESCGHLHLIRLHSEQILFDVFELKRDYSEWSVKYRVDLAGVDNYQGSDSWFSVLSLVRGGEEEEEETESSFLVLWILGKVVRYNLESQRFDELRDYEGAERDGYWPFPGTKCFHYIESLCFV